MTFLNKIGVYALCMGFLLSGCVTNDGGSEGTALNIDHLIGPKLSSFFDPKRKAKVDTDKPKLDIVVPVFDPGLSEDAKNYKEEGVWPELRRAEANRFAYNLKTALEAIGAFGAVRITPDNTATGDLYVIGKIVESNGEDVEIEVVVTDISGNPWFARNFDHTVDPGFHKNPRNNGKDPYDPMFEEAANRIALDLEAYSSDQLVTLKRITELRFGSNFTQEAFSKHLLIEDGKAKLRSFPSETDPMFQRTKAIRVRDQLFTDGLQDTYQSFSERMEASYLIWQEQSLLEIEAKSEVTRKAAGEAVLGILAIGVAVAAVVAGANANQAGDYGGGALANTGAILAGVAGATLLQNSFQTSEEAKVHRDALAEMGESINIDLSPQVIAFEEQTVKLTGDAKAQFSQWREFLKKIYEEEQTPEVQL